MKKSKVTYSRNNTTKMLACECGKIINVPNDTDKVLCGTCVILKDLKLYPPKWLTTVDNIEKPNKFKKPRGWHWLKLYVDPEGNVFRKGKECPEEKGKHKTTKIEDKPVSKEKKVSKREKDNFYRTYLIDIGKKGKEINKLIREQDKTESVKGKNKIKRKIKAAETELKRLKKESRKYL